MNSRMINQLPVSAKRHRVDNLPSSLCADDKPMTFTAGLKTHAAVKFMQFAEINGLQGKFVLDCDADPENPWIRVEDSNSLTFGSKFLQFGFRV
jgi:hypothetical protein